MVGHSARYIEFLNPGSSPALCFLLMCLGGLIFLKRPMLALAFICVQPYFLWVVGVNFGISFYLAYLAVAIILFKYRMRIFHTPLTYYGPILTLSIILILWSILSPMFYPIRNGMFAGYSLSRLNFVGSLLPILLIPRIIRNKQDVTYFILCAITLLAVLNIVVFFCSLALMASGRSLNLLPFTNILGVMPHSWEGALLFICLPFAYAIGSMPKRRIILLVPVAIFCLLIADSRTKVFAAFACSSYIVLPRIRRFFLPVVVVFMSLMFLLFLLPTNLTSQAYNIIGKRVEQTTSDDIDESTSGRETLYAQAYSSFLSSPWVGVGDGYAIRPLVRYGIKTRPSPHSYYIGVLAQQGLIGVGIFACVLAFTIRLMMRLRRVCATSPRDVIMARFINAVVFYGLLCMVFKAHWGVTFWSLALLQVFYNVTCQEKVKRVVAKRSLKKKAFPYEMRT